MAVAAESRQKVMIVVTDTARGGTPLKLASLARSVTKRGWDVRFVSVMPRGEVLDDLARVGIDTESLGLTGWLRLPAALMRLRRSIRAFDPTVVQAALWHANLLSKLAALGTNASVIAGHESIDDDKPSWQTFVDRMTNRFAKWHYAIAGAVAARISQRDHIPMDRIEVIPVGKDLDEFEGLSADPAQRARWGIPPAAKVVGWVGRLHPVKDLPVLVQAVASLGDWWLLLVGEGDEDRTVERVAIETGMSDRLVMAGVLADVRPALAACDVFCLTSRWEGLPAAVMEAMAAGKPVVVSNVGGVGELVTDGTDGFLVEPGDVDGFAAAILRAHQEPQMGVNARETVRARFSLAAMTRSFIDLWEKV